MIKSYAHYDETTGDIKGYYDPELFKIIPEPNIELSEEEWLDCIGNQHLRKIDVIDKQIIKFDIPLLTLVPTPNWSKLTENLRGSMLFAKTYGMASQDTRVNAAFTVLLTCVNSVKPNLADLQFALTQLVTLLPDVLSVEDISSLNELLIETNFPFTV